MKVAVIQLNSTADKNDNIRRASFFVKEAIKRQAQFILLPEIFNFRGVCSKKHLIAEEIPGESSTPFIQIAKQHKVFILLGSVYERIKNSLKVYNTSVLIGPSGKILKKYRKIHLFQARINQRVIDETQSFVPGKTPVLTKIKSFKVGLSICYDLRFPEIYRRYSKEGAGVLVVPSCFTQKTGQAHWHTLLKARAIENSCFVLAPNQCGQDHQGMFAFGHSLIINPWGDILAQASADQEEIINADISLEEIKRVRQILPGLKKHFFD